MSLYLVKPSDPGPSISQQGHPSVDGPGSGPLCESCGFRPAAVGLSLPAEGGWEADTCSACGGCAITAIEYLGFDIPTDLMADDDE